MEFLAIFVISFFGSLLAMGLTIGIVGFVAGRALGRLFDFWHGLLSELINKGAA